MVLLGFVLMVASSSAALVPPYLTRPLIDNVLMPAETRREASRFSQVWLYLARVCRGLRAGLASDLGTNLCAWPG